MIIQRWQSVLLLIAAVMMACFSFVSLGQVTTTDYTFNFTALGFTYEGIATNGAPTGYLVHTWYFFALSLLSALLPLIAIFCYKNYRLQPRLCLVTVLCIIADISVGMLLGYTAIDAGTIGWSANVCEPFIALVATIMAWQCIRRDHKKLADAYRLR